MGPGRTGALCEDGTCPRTSPPWLLSTAPAAEPVEEGVKELSLGGGGRGGVTRSHRLCGEEQYIPSWNVSAHASLNMWPLA